MNVNVANFNGRRAARFCRLNRVTRTGSRLIVSCRALEVSRDADLSALKMCTVTSLADNEDRSYGSLWAPTPGKLTLLVFFTHWADLGSWEFAQRLVSHWDEIQSAGVDVVAVGLGSSKSGMEFSRQTGFPAGNLYADQASACYKALNFSPGFLPGSDLNGYIKIFPMLAGIGSPGTMQEVLRGYLGDRQNGKPIYKSGTLLGNAFNTLGTDYQRPFELATQRLLNMAGSLSKWSSLAPEDTQQLVQQGGCLLLKGSEVVFRHDDTGILITTNIDDLLSAIDTNSPKP